MQPPDIPAGRHAIVLAAGAGTRFDGAKLLAPLDDRPLIGWAVAAALGARVETVTAVLGARADRVRDALEAFDDPRLRNVVCEDWAEGLSASLRCGLAALPDDSRAVAIFLGDMPRCSAAVADAMLERVLAGAPAAMPEFAGRPGHPVAIAPQLFGALGNLSGDRGARAVLEATPGIVRIAVDDPGCIEDVDARADLERLARTRS